MYGHGSSVHQKCSNYALTNLLFGLCKFVWIIDLFITCFSLHPGTLTCLSTLEALWIKECIPIPSSFVIFMFRLTFEFYKEFGGMSVGMPYIWSTNVFFTCEKLLKLLSFTICKSFKCLPFVETNKYLSQCSLIFFLGDIFQLGQSKLGGRGAGALFRGKWV